MACAGTNDRFAPQIEPFRSGTSYPNAVVAYPRFAAVRESDVIGTALRLGPLAQLHYARADVGVVEDRIQRGIIELRAGRRYAAALEARRAAHLSAQLKRVANDATTLAPWLTQHVA